ncbi:hypothetical protein ACH4OV_25415 [Streptomyces diastaticus]|uniref:hypothetical protein n=1 Tax=Streptomyces diastaticus TaxID=1956 RepID=UPI0037B6C49E
MRTREFIDCDGDTWTEFKPGMLRLTEATGSGAEWYLGTEDSIEDAQASHGPLTEVRTDDLDPARVERALRLYVAELAPEKHAEIEDHPADGIDRYCEEAEFFLRCWEATA